VNTTNFIDEELCTITIILDEGTEQLNPNKRKWVHEVWQRRYSEGEFSTLYNELIENETKFYRYFGMSEYCFNILLDKVYAYLKEKMIRVGEKL